MKVRNPKALFAMQRARTALIISQPFYGCLALHLQLVEVNDPRELDGEPMDTMAVDGKHLFYYPPFVLSLDEAEIVGVVMHEVSHCSYQHMTRRGHRDPDAWNVAGDWIINDDVVLAGGKLPKMALFNPAAKGMSTEEAYELIPKSQHGKGGGTGQGSGDPGRCGGVRDAAPGHDKAALTDVALEWEALTRQAIAVARRANAGTLPGYLKQLDTVLKEPRVSWRDQFQRFIDSTANSDYSWARPNRRFASTGLILPGFIPDRLNHVVVFMDVSGSTSSKTLRTEFMSEAAATLDQQLTDQLTVVYIDTKVHHVDEYQSGDIVEAKVMLGGGGTNFRLGFEWVREHAHDASAIVFFTDLMTSDWGEDPDVPVLWAHYGAKQYYDTILPNIPFGEAIHVDTVG